MQSTPKEIGAAAPTAAIVRNVAESAQVVWLLAKIRDHVINSYVPQTPYQPEE
jgi:hypothetical protein